MIAHLQWSSVEAYLGPGHARLTGDRQRMVATVCYLTGKGIGAVTIEHAAPETSPTPDSDRTPTQRPRILLNYHDNIYDHRHLILGQLPRQELFPTVFVKPQDLELWFPQDVIRLKDLGGTAFVCHGRFGNPDGIGHSGQGSLWVGQVLVHAFQSPPDKDRLRNPLSDDELRELVESCGSEAKRGPFEIRRHLPSCPR